MAIMEKNISSPAEWWYVDSSSNSVSISHHRGIYYNKLLWVDHPWAKKWGTERGADFINEWALEIENKKSGEWESTGRGDSDWMETTFKRYNVFKTENEANQFAIQKLLQYIEGKLQNLKELDVQLAELSNKVSTEETEESQTMKRNVGVTALTSVLSLWENHLGEEAEEAIRGILDRAVGYCSPQNRMFPKLPYLKT